VAVDCLIDTNILIRLLVPRDPLAPSAQAAVRILKERQDRLFVAAQNLIEFWAVATRPVSANGLGLSTAAAEEELARLDSLFSVLHETPDVYPLRRDLVSRMGVSGRQAHDARLAAVMLANDMTHVLTFNVDDFGRYPGLVVLDPRVVIASSAT
jgi:predicted nucleic acid-binding protein